MNYPFNQSERGPGMPPEPTIREVISEYGPTVKDACNMIALILILAAVGGAKYAHLEAPVAAMIAGGGGLSAVGGLFIGEILNSYKKTNEDS